MTHLYHHFLPNIFTKLKSPQSCLTPAAAFYIIESSGGGSMIEDFESIQKKYRHLLLARTIGLSYREVEELVHKSRRKIRRDDEPFPIQSEQQRPE